MEITSQDPNLALKEFDAKIQIFEENKKQPSSASVIFWLIFFPPIAFYKMWKYKKFHIWFPNSMIILALLNFLTAIPINVPVSGKLLNSSTELNINYNLISPAPYIAATIIISIIEIVLGIILRRKVQKEGYLNSSAILACLFLIFIQYLPIILMTISIISNISSAMPATDLNQLEF